MFLMLTLIGFISNAPWYAEGEDKQDKSEDYLAHQRSTKDEIKTEWYRRGKKKSSATKYRKGACVNCGSMTHKAADCLERPRKVGAKYNNMNIEADDDIQDIHTTWDSKRDRWNGFDADDYRGIMKDMETRQEAAQAQPLSEQQKDNDDAPITSLRERGERAKYLNTLDDDTTFFNPKSRIMRGEDGSLDSQGYYQQKLKDKAAEFERIQKQAEDLAEKGENVNIAANPTQGMLKIKQAEMEQASQNMAHKTNLIDRYGGEAFLREKPVELRKAPIVADQNHQISTASEARSRYQEDLYPGNHTSVWGSWWSDGKWGYQCCHSTVKLSYCVGSKGQELNKPEKRASSESTIPSHKKTKIDSSATNS